ncbi:hypothetical protein B0T10DRAFT_555891 [Thelonectria olida]|uniref:N-acetylglucosamine-induced protein 1 n=1 Tax=Thelonectria olida TaxID=1576542 RepID=A0A9P8WE76_9HYPO|nr:hypothetical protein B0T10DRAFT_555891 [Thelonectria olida]
MGSITITNGTTAEDPGSIPYWHVNVPESQREAECPKFLLNLCIKDLNIIKTLDADYHILTWEETCELVRLNQLHKFQRIPSQLRRYKAYTSGLIKMYGSVANFIFNERLKWEAPIKPRGAPFEFEDDYKILFNDWPYGIDPKIVHTVVWTKFDMKDDPETGDLTDEGRKEIDDFVTKKFRSHVPAGRVIWFKNWRGIKSVRAVEHFHVMMYDPDPDFVRAITGGDVPHYRASKN